MQPFLSNLSLITGQKSLDALWLRQKVISENIANVDTPGYKSRDVDFETRLLKAIEQGGEKEQVENRLSDLDPLVKKNTSSQAREDGNNVDIDAQNVEYVRTMLAYSSMSRAVSNELSRIKYAVMGGK